MSRAAIRKMTESAVARRDFLKWSGLIGAALGLERGRYLDVLHTLEGNALADSASAESKLGYLITICDGTGGLANWTLPFPMVSNAKAGAPPDGTFHELGKGVKATQTDREMFYSSDVATVFNDVKRKGQQVSAYLCGVSGAHADAPSQIVSGNNTFMASAAGIQTASTTLVPAIGIGQLYGSATGAPAPATVANSSGLVDLFNSAAARTILAPAKRGNAVDLAAYHQAFLRLNSASRSPLQKRFINNSYKAMDLLGQQLSEQLRPTVAEAADYGLDQPGIGPALEIGRALITGMKAMALGLTRQLFLPGFNDDPHGLFGDNRADARAAALGRIFSGYFKQADNTVDSKSGRKMSDKLTLTIYGDLYKNPFERTAWPDACPGNTNIMYAIGGQNLLKSGWFGGFPTGTTPQTFNPVTGATVAMGTAGAVSGQEAFQRAMAAVLFAVSGGDERRVADYAGAQDYTGLVNKSLVGG
jgi:hypothetical protein